MDYMFGNQELSSGCDSGWTLYLQHSSIPPHASYDRQPDSPNRVFADDDEDEEEEDEDLSMVSDASSGPPHLHEEEEDKNGCSSYPYAAAIDEPLQLPTNTNPTRKKKRENRCRNKLPQHHSSLLDDTASSPFFDFCNKTRSQTSVENVVEYSQGYSTTQFEERERSPYEEGHYDFFQSENQLQQKTSGLKVKGGDDAMKNGNIIQQPYYVN